MLKIRFRKFRIKYFILSRLRLKIQNIFTFFFFKNKNYFYLFERDLIRFYNRQSTRYYCIVSHSRITTKWEDKYCFRWAIPTLGSFAHIRYHYFNRIWHQIYATLGTIRIVCARLLLVFDGIIWEVFTTINKLFPFLNCADGKS